MEGGTEPSQPNRLLLEFAVRPGSKALGRWGKSGYQESDVPYFGAFFFFFLVPFYCGCSLGGRYTMSYGM